MPYAKYQTCIDACIYCAAMCHQCASACLEEKEVGSLKTCIRLDLECAAACRSAAEIMMMDGEYTDAFCQVCETSVPPVPKNAKNTLGMGWNIAASAPKPAASAQKNASTCRPWHNLVTLTTCR